VRKASKFEKGKEFSQPSIPRDNHPAIAVQQAKYFGRGAAHEAI
jgi:hypothetical protein